MIAADAYSRAEELRGEGDGSLPIYAAAFSQTLISPVLSQHQHLCERFENKSDCWCSTPAPEFFRYLKQSAN